MEFYDLIRLDVCRAVREAFNDRRMLDLGSPTGIDRRKVYTVEPRTLAQPVELAEHFA